MTSVLIDEPAWARVDPPGDRAGFVRNLLTYTDKQVQYEIRRRKQGEWRLRAYLGDARYDDELAELRAREKPCLVGEGERFPAGLAGYVAVNLGGAPVVDGVRVPEARPLPWKQRLPFPMRDFQTQGVDALIAARHGTLELATGLGKSWCIIDACRRLGLRAVVTAPMSNVVLQLHAEMARYLGPANVGLYGDGSHQLDRLVTVATAQALQRIKPGTARWDALQQVQLLQVDEAHLFAAEVMKDVCLGALANAPYRFFYTATHLRGDGRQLLLDGITGPVLSRWSVEDGVNAGYLARPSWRMLQLEGGVPARDGEDASKATRRLLLTSDRVVATAADVINRLLRAGRPTLVLIEELVQFSRLLPYLRYEAKLAFGGMPSDKKARARVEAALPVEYRKSNPLELVSEFNDGRFPLLVGTSAVGTGVDVRAAAGGLYWRGGASETDQRQGAGRYLRRPPGKSDVIVFDFDVVDGGSVHRHALKRAALWREIYPDYREQFVGRRTVVG